MSSRHEAEGTPPPGGGRGQQSDAPAPRTTREARTILNPLEGIGELRRPHRRAGRDSSGAALPGSTFSLSEFAFR